MGNLHETWWDAVKQLPATHRFVAHEPETPRYARARQKLRYVVREGIYLGSTSQSEDDEQTEIAVWAPSARRGAGYYCCFRLFIEEGVTTGAVLYSFYDGTESSPGFSTLQDALAFAQANGFTKERDDGDQD